MDIQEIEIVVKGRLGHDVLSALDGFSISTTSRGYSRIVGVVPDQARLLGILAMFDELHADVISFHRSDIGAE